MVPDHWSNDAMVSMDRCGLVSMDRCGLGQYNLVLFGMKWYGVSVGLFGRYTLKIGDLVRCHPSRTTTNEQGKIELLSQWTMEGGDEKFGWIQKRTRESLLA